MRVVLVNWIEFDVVLVSEWLGRWGSAVLVQCLWINWIWMEPVTPPVGKTGLQKSSSSSEWVHSVLRSLVWPNCSVWKNCSITESVCNSPGFCSSVWCSSCIQFGSLSNFAQAYLPSFYRWNRIKLINQRICWINHFCFCIAIESEFVGNM